MADQFCRIVDTTMCDMTLGSDASQVILTTDANTSYVIRDIYKEDTSTSATSTYTGDLVMDGITVLSNLNSGAEGTLIVPPSTSLCYVEKSGNYPITFECVSFDVYFCSCCPDGRQMACYASVSVDKNYISSEQTVTKKGCINSGVLCNFSVTDAGCIMYNDTANALVVVYHDNNSITTTHLYCTDLANTGSFSCCIVKNTGYCNVGLSCNEFVYEGSADMHYVIPFGKVGCLPTYCYCYCGFSGTVATSYSEGGLSQGGHPCHHIGCIAFVSLATYNTGAAKLIAIDTCTFCTGITNRVCSELLWCKDITLLPACFDSIAGAAGVQNSLTPFYSEYCDAWLVFAANPGGCISVVNEDGTAETVGYFPEAAGTSNVMVYGRTAFWPQTCGCTFAMLDLDAFVRTGGEISVTLAPVPYTVCCYRCFETCGGVTQQPLNFSNLKVASFSGNSCDYPLLDESTKLVAYGIKST